MNVRQEDGSVRTIEQKAICKGRKEELIEPYGLNQPDIVSYTIEEIANL